MCTKALGRCIPKVPKGLYSIYLGHYLGTPLRPILLYIGTWTLWVYRICKLVRVFGNILSGLPQATEGS